MVDLKDLHIHIIGLGLMGGSLAMTLQGKVGCLTAHDTRNEVLQTAIHKGLINASDGLEQADVVILAIPSDKIVALIQSLQLPSGVMVMDIGSTKTAICDALDGLAPNIESVGGHPMCGLAENGFENAIPTLYQGARFVLCETLGTTERVRSIAEQIVSACGAKALWMDRQQHDYLTGLTSHLPHLLSFALMRLAMQVSDEDEALFQLAAGGFDGATRLARTNATMIRGMFTTNAENIRQLAKRLREQLDLLEMLFDDSDNLTTELQRIVEARRNYSMSYGERPIA
ncbi:MAG: hypothetical protein CUN55_01795 [Phototrophicales bacterium]|nr:MAG: hypothetical protein CUN55_01795 [Phototrophicales bacterium]